MSCLNPILAVSIMKNSEDKHVLKFIPRSEIAEVESRKLVYGSDEVFLLPCMKCIECRKDYAKDWAVRCCLEAKEHPFNYFITLTYDDFHIGKASKSEFDDFLKRLSQKLYGKWNRPKFFACMEKGELTHRIHFHCVLFLDNKLELKKPVKIGDFYHYSCDLLDEVWSKKGFVDVAPFETDCAAYVAKYSTKQGKCFMSRNLGKSYYLKHKQEIIDDDFKVYGDFFGREYTNIPDCFVRWFIDDEFKGIDEYRLKRKHVQKLLMFSQLHAEGKTKEGDLIREKIMLCLKHNRYKAERIEL